MVEPQRIKTKFKKLSKARQILFPLKRGEFKPSIQKGVYIIFDASDRPVHVGCTPRGQWGLYQRLSNHLQGQSSFVWNYRPLEKKGNKLRGKYFYKYLIVKSARQRKLLEAYAIGQLCPKYIGEDGYQ